MDELWLREDDETPVDGRWYGETIPLSGRRTVSFYKDRRIRVWHRDNSQSVELDAVDAWELYEALGYYADDLRELAQAAYQSRKKEVRTMAALIDRMELSKDQRVELDEECVTWIVRAPVSGVKATQKIRLDAAAATRLFDFLLTYEEELVRWRDGLLP